MKNAVFLELRGRSCRTFHWKEYGKATGAEVDFVVLDNFKARELIQVTYAQDKVHERETKALRKAKDQLNPERMTMITWSYRGEIDGVEAVPLWY